MDSLSINEAAWESYYSMRDEAITKSLYDIKDGIKTQPWKVVSQDCAQRVWDSFANLGFIRDEKGLEKIREVVLGNIVKLDANTVLCRHDEFMPMDAVVDAGLSYEELEGTSYFNCDDCNGSDFSWRISDYAVRPLRGQAISLMKTTTPEHTLEVLDMILSITHQRSDLASWFIEGGRSGLDRLGGVL